MLRKFVGLTAYAAIIVAAQNAQANAIPPHDDLQAVLMTLAVKETIDRTKIPAPIVITLDRNVVIASLQEKERGGLLNPVFTSGYINAHKNSLAIVTGLVHSAMTLNEAYGNTDLDRSRVMVVMVLPNDYGPSQKIPLFSFDFSRALYNKVDWEHFDPATILKVAANFRYSPWAAMSAESP